MQEEPRTEPRTRAAGRPPLTETREPSRLDLVESELRLHQVDSARAWGNVQGLVERSFAEPEKALQAMRELSESRGAVSVDDVLEAGLNRGGPLRDDVNALIRELRPRVAAVQDHQRAMQETERRIEALKSERIGAPERQVEALKSERVGSPELATPASELQAGKIDPGDAVRAYREEVAPRLAREASGAELTPELQQQVEHKAQAVLELREHERAVAGLEQQVAGLREPARELARVEARLEESWKQVEQLADRAFAEPDRAVKAMRQAVEQGRAVPAVLEAAQAASELRGGQVSNRASRQEARQALDELSRALGGVTRQHRSAERLGHSLSAGGPALASAEAALGRAQQALAGIRRGDPEASLSDTLRALSGAARTAALAALPPKLQVIARPLVRAVEAMRNLAPDLELGR